MAVIFAKLDRFDLYRKKEAGILIYPVYWFIFPVHFYAFLPKKKIELVFMCVAL